jgi:uncharacterized phiE125 gp8 family phage protein
MPLTRLTPLDGEAILSLADAKAHLRVTHTDEDALIGSLRDAAVSHVERASGVALSSGNWRWTMRSFAARVDLPVRPVTALGTVSYLDASGAEQTYADARLVDGSVLPAADSSWPYAYGSATVEFTTGLTSPDDAPELIAAVKLTLTDLYENRSGATERPIHTNPAVTALIDTHRVVMV